MQPTPETPPTTLTWISHPAKERPGLLMVATGVILTLTLAALWADGSALMALTAGGILLGTTASFFVPTRFTLGRQGIVVAMPGFSRRRRWAELRRWEEDGNGFFVSPYRRPRPLLDGRRGLFLRGGDRDAIRQALTARLGAAAEAEGAPASEGGRLGQEG